MYSDIIQTLEQSGTRKARFSLDILTSLLGPYKAKVLLPHDEYALFGRGSLNFIQWVANFGSFPRAICLEVGNFSEIARDCTLITGGEHKNNLVINNSFSAMADIYNELQTSGVVSGSSILSKGPIYIGSNVTISANVTLLSGVRIGHGAVIGAGSVVTKDIPPFAIAAGNPARVLRYRFDEETIERLLTLRWWDFSWENLVRHYNAIQNMPHDDSLTALASSLYDTENDCYLLFKAVKNTSRHYEVVLSGAEINGTIIPKEHFPPLLQFFAEQLKAKPDQHVYLIRNLFQLLTSQAQPPLFSL
jgi:acetyltransferase-like isoleucine patch superfamily enzyme